MVNFYRQGEEASEMPEGWDEIPAVLEAMNRSTAGRTAPACGLYLAAVDYGTPVPWLCG